MTPCKRCNQRPVEGVNKSRRRPTRAKLCRICRLEAHQEQAVRNSPAREVVLYGPPPSGYAISAPGW